MKEYINKSKVYKKMNELCSNGIIIEGFYEFGDDSKLKKVYKKINKIESFLQEKILDSDFEEIVEIICILVNEDNKESSVFNQVLYNCDKLKPKFDTLSHNKLKFYREIYKENFEEKEIRAQMLQNISKNEEIFTEEEKTQKKIVKQKIRLLNSYDVLEKEGLEVLLNIRYKMYKKLRLDEEILDTEESLKYNEWITSLLGELEMALFYNYKVFESSYKHLDKSLIESKMSEFENTYLNKLLSYDIIFMNKVTVEDYFEFAYSEPLKISEIPFTIDSDSLSKYKDDEISKIIFFKEEFDKKLLCYKINGLSIIDKIIITYKINTIIKDLYRYKDELNEELVIFKLGLNEYINHLDKNPYYTLNDVSQVIVHIEGKEHSKVLATLRKIATDYIGFDKYKNKNENNQLQLDNNGVNSLLSIYLTKNNNYQSYITAKEVKEREYWKNLILNEDYLTIDFNKFSEYKVKSSERDTRKYSDIKKKLHQYEKYNEEMKLLELRLTSIKMLINKVENLKKYLFQDRL